eukprot:TRINITY_DN5470_c1_g1_i4.p1 TRINITY_DN5470_c1_g1~~TRINITY_DN5470_c1_g1_i4.p1  ORF type:complete len:370 (-),score=41.53 TRINITY_DN5470_c1_g1_i4:255-1364(-)
MNAFVVMRLIGFHKMRVKMDSKFLSFFRRINLQQKLKFQHSWLVLWQYIKTRTKNFTNQFLKISFNNCSKKFDQVVKNLSPSAIEMLILMDQKFVLKGYEYLHQHHKRKISPQVWKSALLAAKKDENYKKGYQILKQIEVKPSNHEWQLNTQQLFESKFYFHLLGNNDVSTAYDVLQQQFDQIGVSPSQEMLLILLQEFEKNAYNSGKFVYEILYEMYKKDPKWPKGNIEIFSQMLSILSQSSGTSMEQAVAMQLSIIVSDEISVKREKKGKENFVRYLEQCQFFGTQFLAVLFLIMVQNEVISNEIVDSVDSDEKTAKFLSEIFGVVSVVDSIYLDVNLNKLLTKKGGEKIKHLVLDILDNLALSTSL